MFSREKAEKIARDFMGKMNPTNWNGQGRKPKSFDTRIVTYDIDSINGNELDISFDHLEEDGWTHYCELRVYSWKLEHCELSEAHEIHSRKQNQEKSFLL